MLQRLSCGGGYLEFIRGLYEEHSYYKHISITHVISEILAKQKAYLV